MPRNGNGQQWLNSPSTDAPPTPSATQWQQRSAPAQASTMAPMPQAPTHPVPQMQGAFEESMRETMAEPDAAPETNPYLDADKFKRRKMLLESQSYERTVAGRWLQKPGENFHPLWKLVAQISFGMHLLHMGLARSDADVIQILQTHVDEIDGFLERTTEDFELAQQDVNDRIKHLRTPLEHGDVFDNMLVDREFRTAIVDGNEKIEHILSRTTVAMKDALKDIQKGLDGTKQLARFLRDIDRKWPNRTEEHAAVFAAMMGNTEGWAGAYKSIQQKGSDLGLSLVQLEGIVSEIQRRAGVASRRNLPIRHSTSSNYRRARDSDACSPKSSTPLSATLTQSPPSELQSPHSLRKFLPVEPSATLAISRAAKASQAIELPAEVRYDRKSMHASVIHESASETTHSSEPSQLTPTQSDAQRPPLPSGERSLGTIHADHISEQLAVHDDKDEEKHQPAELHEPTPQSEGRTFFDGSSDTGSTSAHSAQSKDNRVNSHVKNTSSLSSNDLRDLGDEDGVVNAAHPLLQDIRAREILVINTGSMTATRNPLARKSVGSAASPAQRNSIRGSDSSANHPKSLSESSPVDSSYRDSSNTIANPVSLKAIDKETSSSITNSINTRVAPQVTPSPSGQTHSEPQVAPPSPPLAELTSATISGPELGDPFAPTSPREGPRHPELIDRITSSLRDSNPGSEPRSAAHSRTASKTKTSTSAVVTTTTTTTSIPTVAPMHVTTATRLQPTQRLDGRTYLQPQAAVVDGPQSPPLSTQYRNLSPFPSTSSRGSRRPSVPLQGLDNDVDAKENRKSGFKKFFHVKRNSRKDSLSNF